MTELKIIGVTKIPLIKPGDDLANIIINAVKEEGLELLNGDVLVVTQKIVSKAEGRLVELDKVSPSYFAKHIHRRFKKDPRLIEVLLSETNRIVKMDKGVIIIQTKSRFICANGGIDQSNIPKGFVSLLPKNPDHSAKMIKYKIYQRLGVDLAIIISDTFGRPWREGYTNVALGVAGLNSFMDYRGCIDNYGYKLKVTLIAVADELASAAELVMGKTSKVPVAIIRGYDYPKGNGSGRQLIRKSSKDLFK